MDPSLIMYIIVSFLLLFLTSDGHVVFENGSQKEQLIFHLTVHRSSVWKRAVIGKKIYIN